MRNRKITESREVQGGEGRERDEEREIEMRGTTIFTCPEDKLMGKREGRKVETRTELSNMRKRKK